MSADMRQRIAYQTEPEYPSLAEAEAYADDFRTGATNAYAKDEKWAKYWLSGYLDILTTRLQANIYAVVSYPPAGFEVALAGDIEVLEHFRGWIFQYDKVHSRWSCLIRSQEVGIDEFIRLRREYKAG
ncbi:unnamed protein product [marine sediment metagenome]|uniref:Uncharacterized protein n=1 Tax=marine sediment metagenome TaxID=412755 RepID=X1T3R8_9ZZZZ